MKNNNQSRNGLLIKTIGDLTNKKVCYCFLYVLILLIFLVYLLAIFLVPHTFIYLLGAEKCQNIKNFKGLCHEIDFSQTLTWTSYLSNLDKKNQFLVISGKFQRKVKNPEINLEVDYELEIIPVDEFGEKKEESKFYKENRKDKLSILCQQDKYECQKKVFILYPQINHDKYKVIIKFDIPNNLRNVSKGIKFEVMTISDKYTNFLLGLRYSFLILSLISGIIYVFFFIKTPKKLRTFEHKYIMFLSFSLFFFNDPFYGATILEASTFLAILSTFFVVQFLSLLIIFWNIMIQRIHLEKVRVGTKLLNKVNIVLGVVGFILLMITGASASIIFRFDPGFHAETEFPTFYRVFQVFFILYLIILLFLFFMNIYKISKLWRMIIQRHKIFLQVTFFFVISLFILGIFGIYQSYDSDGVKVFLLIFICNLYVFVLQILWRFASKKDFRDYIKNLDETKDMDNYEKRKDKGFNYFHDNSEIKINRIDKNNNSVMTEDNNLIIKEDLNLKNKDEIERQKFLSIQRKFDQEDSIEINNNNFKSDSNHLELKK